MRGRNLRRAAAVALLAALAVAWAIPSDVVALIAENDHVLLGRYAEGYLVALALATLLALPTAAMLWAGTRLLEIALRLVLVVGSCALAFAVVSIALRVPATPRYVETPVEPLARDVDPTLVGITRRRQPDERFEIRRADRPGPERSYPNAPPGFETATVTLTTDAQGFRNPDSHDRWDIVVVGDSFAEGSMVSDGEVWTEELGERLGRTVFNAAVSGASPREYLNNLAAFGLEHDPRLVIVSVYEGNDFKPSRPPPPLTAADAPLAQPGLWERVGAALSRYRSAAFEDSPLRARLKSWLIGTLGPVRADAPVPDSPVLSWMPVAVPSPAGTHYYSFEPKRLMRLYWEPERFERSPAWTTNAEIFRHIHALTTREGIPLVMVYVPSKPHVVMPLVRDRVPPEALRAFAALEEDDLPPPEAFRDALFQRLDSQERVFLSFCRSEGIPCISLTAPLREHMAAGEAVYFTYDPHWTRLGHAVAAQVVAEELASLPLPAAEGAP